MVIQDLREAFEANADHTLAPGMSKYMKNRYPFLGLKTPLRRAAQKPIFAELGGLDESALLDLAIDLYTQPEREFAYAGSDLLRQYSQHLTAASLPALEQLVQTKSWWDTVDALATHPVSDVVHRHPELSEVMDQWIHDPDIWVARTAILHQLLWKDDTNAERLFGYCDARCEDKEFFIRKALGWALRHYARTDPEAVRAYVRANEANLSGLTKREALKHIGP